MKRTQHTAYTLSLLLLASATVQAENIIIGATAGAQLTSGDFNVFIGEQAGFSNTSASSNSYVGAFAGLFSTGAQNTYIGTSAGQRATGSSNAFLGVSAGSNSSGSSNTFMGKEAGKGNLAGSFNTFVGAEAGGVNAGGNHNTFMGASAGFNNIGSDNTFIGLSAGLSNTSGVGNTFIGVGAGTANALGARNTYLGRLAGAETESSDNVFLGYQAGQIEGGSSKLYIANTGTSTPLIYGEFDNAILGINGSLGVGTQLPTSTLHVQRADGSAKILVEETNAVQGPRTLFEIKNKGNPEFRMTNSGNGNSWLFSAGQRFVVKNNAGDWVSRITASGDMEITGLLTESSDVNGKQDIESVDGRDVLEKLANLKVSEWSYKDSPTDRHVGPMAQDFYATFGLGHTDKGIATLDTSGVALAAIKALIEENTALKEKNLSLEQQDKEMQQQINVLHQQNQRIEELVMRIVMDQAEPVAMK